MRLSCAASFLSLNSCVVDPDSLRLARSAVESPVSRVSVLRIGSSIISLHRLGLEASESRIEVKVACNKATEGVHSRCIRGASKATREWRSLSKPLDQTAELAAGLRFTNSIPGG